MNYIFLVSVLVLFVVPVVFVWHSVYDDGLLGRVALVGISFSSFIFALKIYSLGTWNPWPETVLLMASFATFLSWHLWKFTRRIRLAEKAQRHEIERRHAHGS